MLDGVPTRGTMCDLTIRGDAFPFLPKLQGTFTTPATSTLLHTVPGPLSCQYDLVGGEDQSVVLTVTGTSPDQDCRTVCDGTGCRCSLHTVDHILLHSKDYTQCVCGNYQVLCRILHTILTIYTGYTHSQHSQYHNSLQGTAEKDEVLS